MGFAQASGVPVILIGDIDRGGVIAQIVGTQAVLDPAGLGFELPLPPLQTPLDVFHPRLEIADMPRDRKDLLRKFQCTWHASSPLDPVLDLQFNPFGRLHQARQSTI